MPPDRTRPRQDPVSCESCRKKKLKCDRCDPCSNCSARGIQCVFHGRKGPASASSPVATSGASANDLRIENAAIKARLQRLEALVLSEGSATASALRANHSLDSPATSVSAFSESEDSKVFKGDFHWLLRIGTQDSTGLPLLSRNFNITVENLSEIIQLATQDYLDEHSIVLPLEDQALALFEAYADQLDPVQHIVHRPTMRNNIKHLYNDLRTGVFVEPSRTVLLLAILASIGGYWSFGEQSISISAYDTPQRALLVSMLFLRKALDLLDVVRRTSAPNLETLQSTIIIDFLIYHFEGFSPRVRALNYVALCLAKDLGLHRTDAHHQLPANETQDEIVEREFRRRVWWHLVATDWGLALSGGPHEGTYTINPNHMKVNRPRNISDEDLMIQPADADYPLSVPTIMSYYFQRLRLCEICRQVADVAGDMEIDDLTAEQIKLIDQRFQSLADELPQFLRMDLESRQQSQYLDATHPYLTLQRYIINLFQQSRRGKFHLPFLLKASHDNSFAFSRDACLKAARAVIAMKKELSSHAPSLWMANSRLCGVLHLFFYAAVVLVMDLCVNRTAGNEDERKREIEDAFNTLELAKQQSNSAGKFLDSLEAILRKHRIRLHNKEQGSELEHAAVTPVPSGPYCSTSTPLPANGIPNEEFFNNLDFDDLWRSFFDAGQGLDPQNWDALISELDIMVE